MITQLHVALNGCDNWNGLEPHPNADRTDGPLATLEGARKMVRLLRQQNLTVGTVRVVVHPGRYRLVSPLSFGTGDHDLHYIAAAPGVILRGFQAITGWTEQRVDGRRQWSSPIGPLLAGRDGPRSLFVNGRRCDRTRYPENGYLVIEDVPDHPPQRTGLFDSAANRFITAEGDFKASWRNRQGIEVVVNHLWIEERMPVADFDPGTRLVTCTHRSIFSLRNAGWMGSTPCAKYYLENVAEMLLRPGQWYADRETQMIHYLPHEEEQLDACRIEVPLLRQLVRIHGDLDAERAVRGIHFEGITFEGTDWSPAEGWGRWWDPETPPHSWRKRDSFDHFDRSDLARTGLPKTDRIASVPQAAHDLPGAISFEAATNCSLRDCTLRAIGFYAVDVRGGCEGLRFEGNLVEDIGGGGFKIDGASVEGDQRLRTRRIHIGDNRIRRCGRVFPAAVGVLICHADHAVVEFNEINDLFYTAVSVGWMWGYAESPSHGHLIQFNHIYDIGKGRLSDMGGIYTLGVQPGTVLRGNHIHHVRGSHYGGWGIYLDQASSFITVEGNLVHHTNSQCFNEHWGRANVIRDNIFALAESECAQLCSEELENHVTHPAKGCLFLRNVLLTKGRAVFKDSMNYLGSGALDSNLNLIWDVHGRAPVYCAFTPWPGVVDAGPARDVTLEDARSLGLELHSHAGDPLFMDPENGDFTLLEKSPAHGLGIRLLDTSRCGPRPPDLRTPQFHRSFRSTGAVRFSD